jgi:hypothetical protein
MRRQQPGSSERPKQFSLLLDCHSRVAWGNFTPTLLDVRHEGAWSNKRAQLHER